jgi:hypothetical protein
MAINVTAVKTSYGCKFSYTPSPTDPNVWDYFPPASGASVSDGSDTPSGSTHKIKLFGTFSHDQEFTCKIGTQLKKRTFKVKVS